MKISIITWDASFREKFHAVDTFCQQNYPVADFELIWVDFYNNQNRKLLDKIDTYTNARILNLEHKTSEPWHLGVCINAGIRQAKGEILVFPDGDIIVQKDHLKVVADELTGREDLVIYFRRWDELQDTHGKSSYDEDYLEQNTRLLNATNYAGCYAVHKSVMQAIDGYEEDGIFAGPGANAMETYLRIRNAGYAVKWHPGKIYHPWHPATGTSDKKTRELVTLSRYVNWLNPYQGISQSWVLKNRESDLSYQANDGKIKKYMESAPSIEDLRKRASKNPLSTIRKWYEKIIS